MGGADKIEISLKASLVIMEGAIFLDTDTTTKLRVVNFNKSSIFCRF